LHIGTRKIVKGEEMDMIGYMNKVNKYGRYLLILVLLVNLFSMSFASSNIKSGLKSLCQTSQAVLGGIVMLLIVLAGATYAVGQVLGAETRARATVWATAMLTGALIGAVIYLITPPVMRALFGTSTGISLGTSADPCAF
jgi:hypothetical protein